MNVGEIIILCVTSAGLIGLVLTIVGWTGRHVGDHPHCAACNFDLYGLSNPSNCPECGASLRRGGYQLGRFERRWNWVALGLLILLPGALMLGMSIVNYVRGVPWIQREPIWYLTRTMNQRDYLTASPELTELQRRMTAGELSNDQMKYLAREMIRLQAEPDPPAKWHPMMGRLVEHARWSNNLSDKDWNRYLFDAPQADLGIRPITHMDDPLAVQFFKGFRLGAVRLAVVVEVMSIRIDGHDVTDLPASMNARLQESATISMPFLIEQHLPPGQHELAIAIRIADHATPANAPPPAVSRTYTFVKPFAVSEVSETVTPRREKELVDLYREKLTPHVQMRDGKVVPGVLRTGGSLHVSFDYSLYGQPIGSRCGLAFDVLVRVKGQERPAGELCVGVKTTGLGTGMMLNSVPDDVNGVRVILRPNRAMALRHFYLFDYLDAELVYDVPVIDPAKQ
jgi:hypothetical protein